MGRNREDIWIMNKEQKNKYIILSIIVAVVLTLLFFSNKPFTLPNVPVTYYASFYTNSTAITYMTVTDYELNGFTGFHVLNENAGNYFECSGNTCPQSNKNMFRFYLEMNGIDSRFFTQSDVNDLSVFSPIGASGYCPNPVGNNITEIQALGFGWDTACSWNGRYSPDVLKRMANNMVCMVTGKTTHICSGGPIGSMDRCITSSVNYNIQGTVNYESGNGFVCNVDVASLRKLVPSDFIDSSGQRRITNVIGVDGKVMFYKKPVTQPPTPQNISYLYIIIFVIIVGGLFYLYKRK